MIRYLTGASNARVAAVAQEWGLGLMAQPRTAVEQFIPAHPFWAADNGCFSQGERFDLSVFLAWLASLQPYRASCLFAVAPDVWADGPATLARSLPVLPQMRALGFPAALVLQPGVTKSDLPWGAFDCAFVGGPDPWHRSEALRQLVAEARARGVYCHEGKVNSLRRLRAAEALGCHSADGTLIRFGPDANLPRVGRWITALRQQPPLPLLEVG